MVIFGVVHMCLLSLKGYSLTRRGVSVRGIRVINSGAVLHHWCDWATDTHTDLGVWGYFFPLVYEQSGTVTYSRAVYSETEPFCSHNAF